MLDRHSNLRTLRSCAVKMSYFARATWTYLDVIVLHAAQTMIAKTEQKEFPLSAACLEQQLLTRTRCSLSSNNSATLTPSVSSA
jgi:hypothetical protein